MVGWQEEHPACKNLESAIFKVSSISDFWGIWPCLEWSLGKYVKQKQKVVVVAVIVIVVVVVGAVAAAALVVVVTVVVVVWW